MTRMMSGALAALVSTNLLACAMEMPEEEERISTTERAIINGTRATEYPAAVLVNAFMSGNVVRCSGTVVSPHVVVTAAICLYRFGPYEVILPGPEGEIVEATSGAVFDWSPTNPQPHNIGVIFLSSPIELDTYPVLAESVVPDGTACVRLGRSQDGMIADDSMFVSPPVALSEGVPFGFPFEYVADGLLESGDMGGGVFVGQTLVGVNSNAGDGKVAMTRVDLVVDWLREQIARVDGPPPGSWVDMTENPHACQDRPGAPCGWDPSNTDTGYTCGLRHPTWAEPWTCEPGVMDPNWVDMNVDPAACMDRPGVPCGWSPTDNSEGYTCGLRHPEWAVGWTCERI